MPWPKGNKFRLSHGMTGTRTWLAWIEMRRRCIDQRRNNWKDYGGRGITFCDRWDSFFNFLSDMGICPDSMELERKDHNGNYEPSNCKWATEEQQQNNRRSNIFLTINGTTLSISQWARYHGISPRTAAQRIRYGWPHGLAVSRVSDKGMRRCI